MPTLLERLKKLRLKDTPTKRLLKGEFTEKDKEKFLIHFKKEKRERERKKILGK